MSHDHHHSDNGSEPKEVSFTVPLILAAVAVFIIVMFVSLGDPCPDKCCCKEGCSKECAEACEKSGHEMKHEGEAKEGHEGQAAVETPEGVKAESNSAAETATAAPAEEKKEEAHH